MLDRPLGLAEDRFEDFYDVAPDDFIDLALSDDGKDVAFQRAAPLSGRLWVWFSCGGSPCRVEAM
jgi:hypothetical protein